MVNFSWGKSGWKPLLRCELLHSFFAEASSLGCALTGFELGVALADNIERAFALHDLTVFVALFHGEE